MRILLVQMETKYALAVVLGVQMCVSFFNNGLKYNSIQIKYNELSLYLW